MVLECHNLWLYLLLPGLQALIPDGGEGGFLPPIFTPPTEPESLMSNRATVVALILIALLGVLPYLFLGSKPLVIGAVVAILFVAIARIVPIWAPKS